MAFHVACPITTKRICFCKLGFPQKVQSEKAKKGFLEDVFRVEEFFSDSCSIRDTKKSGTVQVVVPKVVPEAAKTVVDGLKKRAVAGSIEAEDYGRKLEARGFALVENVGEAVRAIVEDQGVKVMCRLCFHTENEESDRANRMLGCKLCDKKYHRSCLISWGHNRDLFHLSSWVCPSCRTCEGCRKTGDVTKFVFCKRCDAAYHSSCQPHLSKQNAFNGPYLCPKHTECHSCGSNVPGNGTSTRWFLGYTCCDACGRLFVKGNYCSVCLKVYRDSELTPMVCCDVCDHWVHCQCDGISEERYLQFQADGNLRYKCAACRGDCYKVTGLDDAVQELWRRRDISDRDQIATLRDSIGLPSEEAFSVSIYSDDEDNSPIVLKKEYEPLLKFSVKGSIHKETTNTKEYGKKLSNKKYGKKNEYKVPLNGEVSGHQTYEGLHDRRAIEFTLTDEKNDDIQLYRTEVMDILPPSARILGNTKENCSINQAGTMKHNFVEKVVANNEDRSRTPKVAQIKSSESHGPALGFCYGTQASKSENVKRKKLVIHLGARNSNINNSPRSEASSCHREQDVTAPNGTEDTMYRKVSKKYALEKTDGATRIHDSEGEKSGKRVQLTYSRNREGSSIKLGRFKPEVSVLTSESGKGNSTGPTAVGRDQVLLGRSKAGSEAALESGTGAPALRAEEIPLRRHSKGTPDIHIETCDRTHNTSTLDSSPKDPKPLLKLKFKSPHLNKRNSWVPQEEEKSSNKRQRSKRKRPETNQVSEEEEEEEEGRTQVHQDSLVNEVMDANWILKKLGKDAIGKRVEVHHPADDSWYKGEVTDMIEGRTTIVVRLDDGGSKTLELGRQAIRFVSQKQKRSNS